MNVRFILQVIAKAVFRLSFYFGATAFAFFVVFGNPAVIKRTLINVNAYGRFVPAVIQENIRTNQASGSLSLKDPKVQQIIAESFPARSLEFNAERFINATSDWLNGRTETLTFKTDFTPNINLMADKLSAYAINRLAFLPVCPTTPQSVNPFTDNCRPEFYDLQQAKTELAADIRANNGILPKTVLTEKDLPKNQDGLTLPEQYNYAPKLFLFGKYSGWIFLAIALQSALVIMYTARKKREAVKYIGVTIVSSSVFLALTPLVYLYILPKAFSGFATKTVGSGVAGVLESVISQLNNNFNFVLVQLGVLFALFGLSILVLEKGSRPKSKYLKVPAKAGLASSEPPRNRKGRGTIGLLKAPIQTSEGERNTGKYQRDKKYRKVPRKEI